MNLLEALSRAYERLPDAPPFGYSNQNIGFVIGLNADGSVASVTDLREADGAKKIPRQLPVPQPVKRTSGIRPNFLWDKTAYVLGVTTVDENSAADEHTTDAEKHAAEKDAARAEKRTADEHAAFVKLHVEALADNYDEGLRALVAFLEGWSPEHFVEPLWPEDMKDQNVVFALESERKRNILLHERPAARTLWELQSAHGDKTEAPCLVTGETAPIARLHPAIKGVWGAQSSGASIVSFNLDAFESYGHGQGDNAPVSEQAAFAYTTALNRFLEKESGHRMQIGDASTVFWADASDASAATTAEAAFALMFGGEIDETMQTKKVATLIDHIRQGRRLVEVAPDLAEGVHFNVLGLAPNASRISIRFWFANDFGVLAENYRRFMSEMDVDPRPSGDNPSLWRHLIETAVQKKGDNIAPNLAGDWFRSILAGTPYPMTLFSNVLMRIRADREINALRVAMLKAVLIRNLNREVPMALDPDNTNKGYLLGRLFAVYEQIQRAALGNEVNATIKDKFYGTASAQPRKVFPLLAKGSTSHLSKLGKGKPGYRVTLERALNGIMDMMSPGADPFPTSFTAAEQALFALGYHHQHSDFFRKKDSAPETPETDQ